VNNTAQKPADPEDNIEPWQVHLARNPSYFASLQATFGRVLFYSPSAWWWLVSAHLKAALVGLLVVPLLTLFWVITTLGLVVAGLVGFLTKPKTP
jgi:hypothetical protein